MTTAVRDNLDLAREARHSRADAIIDSRIDGLLDHIGLSEEEIGDYFSEADTVGPEARHKLRGILRHYAKMAHPFTACVRDNRKRFGPRVNAVCAVLKDIIRGTTKWRGHPALDHGSPGAIAASVPPICTQLEPDVVALLERVDEDALDAALFAAEPEGENFATLTAKARKNLPPTAFVFPKQKRYPIHDRRHGANALARAKGKPEYEKVRAAVCKRHPGLATCQQKGSG